MSVADACKDYRFTQSLHHSIKILQVITYHAATCNLDQIIPTFREFMRMVLSCTSRHPTDATIIPGVNDLPPKYSDSKRYEKVTMINYLPEYANLSDKHDV